MATPPRAAGAVLGVAHKFVLTADSYTLGSWSKVTGLGVSFDPAEYRVGNSDTYYIRAGIPKFSRLKFSRAAGSDTNTVKGWLDTVVASGGTPSSGALKMCSPAGAALMTWTLAEMIPMTWNISDFDAGATKVAVETLEVAYSGFLTMGRTYGSGGRP